MYILLLIYLWDNQGFISYQMYMIKFVISYEYTFLCSDKRGSL